MELSQADIVNSTIEIASICPKHKIKLTQLDRVVGVYDPLTGQKIEKKPDPFCKECVTEAKINQEHVKSEELQNKTIYFKTYDVLFRDSIIPNELKGASFNNFLVESDEEKRLLDFSKQQANKYLEGMTGNTLITGPTGVGKSHLSISIARAINDGYKAKNEPKSVLFVTFDDIVSKIQNGWNYGKQASLTEEDAVRLLTKADYLFLDDLGAKNAEIKPKSDWEQNFLFKILNARENTIINTNLDSSQLRRVYNERNTSRILKGLEGNNFKVFSIKDKRYSINSLREKQKNLTNKV
ncbi:putative phage replication protein [Streptococcus uberis]|uniref:ATP-binding protein n=1 Tax=Streptococcus uberis TaxID=1349 RepID=UPI000DA30E28|nr:ATP-binding protein [Streptococcus uberis]SQG84106.1 putative phage replication protein [Streptococcus uberis]